MNNKIIKRLNSLETEFNKYSGMLETIRVKAIDKEIRNIINKKFIGGVV